MEEQRENETFTEQEGNDLCQVDAEKHARFMEESKDRMSKICQQISYLEKIAGKRTVDYTVENVEKMFSYLEKQLADCKAVYMARFDSGEKKNFDFDF